MRLVPLLSSLRDLDAAGLDVRAWCFGCARGDVVPSTVWGAFERKRWSIGVIEARYRFRCKRCGSAEQVLLVPASRPAPAPLKSWDAEVAAFFHASRSERKRRSRR